MVIMKMKLIFDISDELDKKLEQVMEKRQNSKASICRWAITRFLDEEFQNEQQNQAIAGPNVD